MGAKEARGPRRVRLEPERIAAVEVLLIGAAGLVGSHIRAALRGRRALASYHRTPVPNAIALDVTEERQVRHLIARYRPASIVLAAAEAYVERCELEPEATRRLNVDAARTVVEAARDVGATLAVFSSEYVFDGRAGPYAEDDAVRPLNEYGRQKVELEETARTMDRHIICRTSGVFGWESAGKNFVCQLIRRLRSGREFDVPSDQVITPTYAPELGRAVVELLDKGETGTFHIVGPRVMTRMEFARLAADAFDLPPGLLRARSTGELGLVAPRPRNCGLRDAKLRRVLGGPLMNLSDALREMRKGESSA